MKAAMIAALFSIVSEAAVASGITLTVEPRKVIPCAEFLSQASPFSIALDGYASGPTQRNLSKPAANFNHHEDVDRTSTLSTAAQVHREINLGLFNTFRDENGPRAELFVNDCDQDTCLAVWLLKNHERVVGHAEPLINRLVAVNDILDATAGTYPLNADSKILKEIAWIFEPYNTARYEGRLSRMSATEMKTVIESVEQRISKHVLGQGSELNLDGGFQVLQNEGAWSVVTEQGPYSRLSMSRSGITSFLTVLDEAQGKYVLGRSSAWYPFPLDQLYGALNQAEEAKSPGVITASNNWNGSNTIGGSPRQTGSRLSLQEIIGVIKRTLGSKRSQH